MSADNWTTCPQCRAQAQQEVDDAKALLLQDYGVVPVEEFKERNTALLEAELALSEGDALTFREDYEWYGGDKGIIFGNYRGSCQACGLKVKVAVEHPFYPEVKE